jgi:hypothetical protein
MKIRFFILFLHCLILGLPYAAAAEKTLFRFGVVAQAAGTKLGDSDFAAALPVLDDEKLAFVVADGIKSRYEPCMDELYDERRDLLDQSKNPVILSLNASDWTRCRSSSGKPASAERLNRIREVFFSENFSFGKRKIPLARQSVTPQFRSYSENSRWQIQNILFATLHLPRNNNNYVSQAGRNAEFEDRLIANRDWLQKILISAKRKKVDGIVLFSDGNPFNSPEGEKLSKDDPKRDGFREIRRQIQKLASGFSGKILFIHMQAAQPMEAAAPAPRIRWNRNVGELGVNAGISLVSIISSSTLFTLEQVPRARIPAGEGRP